MTPIGKVHVARAQNELQRHEFYFLLRTIAAMAICFLAGALLYNAPAYELSAPGVAGILAAIGVAVYWLMSHRIYNRHYHRFSAVLEIARWN